MKSKKINKALLLLKNVSFSEMTKKQRQKMIVKLQQIQRFSQKLKEELYNH